MPELVDTQLASSSANAAAANNNAITPAAGTFAFLTGFDVTGAGATAASVITVTVTGLAGGTLNYKLAIPAGAAVGVSPLSIRYVMPRQGSAAAGAITVNVPSFGAGNTDAAVVVMGYQAAVA